MSEIIRPRTLIAALVFVILLWIFLTATEYSPGDVFVVTNVDVLQLGGRTNAVAESCDVFVAKNFDSNENYYGVLAPPDHKSEIGLVCPRYFVLDQTSVSGGRYTFLTDDKVYYVVTGDSYVDISVYARRGNKFLIVLYVLFFACFCWFCAWGVEWLDIKVITPSEGEHTDEEDNVDETDSGDQEDGADESEKAQPRVRRFLAISLSDAETKQTITDVEKVIFEEENAPSVDPTS